MPSGHTSGRPSCYIKRQQRARYDETDWAWQVIAVRLLTKHWCRHGGPALYLLLTLLASRESSSQYHGHEIGAHVLLGSTFTQGQTIIPLYSLSLHSMPQPVVYTPSNGRTLYFCEHPGASVQEKIRRFILFTISCSAFLGYNSWLAPVRKTLANGA